MKRSLYILSGLLSLACFAPGPVPAPWTDQDIGTPASAGSATFDPATSTWAVTGCGGDIWNNTDQCNLAMMPVTGDVTISAHLVSMTSPPTDGWEKGGVMIRNDNTPGSVHAFMAMSGSNGWSYQRRITANAGSSSNDSGGVVVSWLRVQRVGTTFSGFVSNDGVTWTAAGTPQTITMNAGVLVGFAVTSHNNTSGVLNTATFDHVVVTDGSGNYLWPEAPPTGLTATAGIDQAVLNWTAAANATSYTILRGTATGGPYPTTVASGVTGVTYTDTTALFPGTFYYIVEAIGPIGTSPYSNEASCTPLQPNITAGPTPLQVAENGGTTSFTVTLAKTPTANVVVQIASANPAALLLTAPGGAPQGTVQLTFTPGGAGYQQVTVTGVEQHLEGAPMTVAINFTSVTSTDPNYPSNYVPPPLSCTIIEDLPAIIVNPSSGLSTTNGGLPVTFTVQLATIPVGNVTLNLSVSDPNLATVAPLQITTAAWNNPVTVTVTPLNANTQTTYIAPYDIIIDSTASTDPAYAAIGQVLVPIGTPVNLPPLTKVWGGSGCGLTGLEGFVALGFLAWVRRRRGSRQRSGSR